MVKKPKDKNQVAPQGNSGAIGSSQIGGMALGESKPLSQRIMGTGAYEIQPYFRANMRTELQKFGYKEEARQLLLGEDSDLLDPENKVEVYGLDLSVSEDRALDAIQKLLDKTGYRGNMPGEERQITAFKWQGYIPRLSITYSEFYEAYGLKPAGDGRYHGAQAQEALDSLWSLTETRRIYYKRDKWTGSGKTRRIVSDIINTPEAPIKIWTAYRDLEAEESEVVMSGGDIPGKRVNKLIIEPSVLLLDQIDSFFLLKPSALHEEIKSLFDGKRYAPTIKRFINYLLTLNMQSSHISRKALARKLWLDYLLDQRKPTLLDKKIHEALEVALELGFLLHYEETSTGLIDMTLNPERCKRINMSRKTKKSQEAI